MASVERREPRRAGSKAVYRVRFRDPAGAQRSRSFARKSDAERFAAGVETDKARGSYIDASLGRMSLAAYAAQWLEMQTSDESTREAQARRLRVHILPDLGATPLAALRATQVQSWLRSKQITLAPSTVRVVFGTLSAVMASAVDDDRIAKNPCQAGAVRLPKRELKRIVPWSASQVALLHEALPDRYQAALIIAAGLGLRQSEL